MVRSVVLLWWCLTASAYGDGEKSYQDMASGARDRVTSISPSEVPRYDDPARASVERDLEHIPTGGLEHAGSVLHHKESQEKPEGIHATTEEASSPKHVVDKGSFDRLGMFTRADGIMQDKNHGCGSVVPDAVRISVPLPKQAEHAESCTSPITRFACEKELKLRCKEKINCAIRGNVSSNMVFTHQDDIVLFGQITRELWRHSCGIFGGTATFTIHHTPSLQEFMLIETGFDDHIQIIINGQTVYVGPYGGTTLEVKGGSVFNGKERMNCELATNWIRYPNLDLRPYLKEGANIMEIKVVVAGSGEGWVKIRTKQECCTWEENWVEHCEQRL